MGLRPCLPGFCMHRLQRTSAHIALMVCIPAIGSNKDEYRQVTCNRLHARAQEL